MSVLDLTEQPHWRPLARFVSRWFRDSLGATRLSAIDVTDHEAKIGCTFPAVVREWYELVGHRLHDVNQDWAVRLHEQQVRDGRLVLWRENQGNWRIEIAQDDPAPDPMVTLAEWDHAAGLSATTTEALVGMVCSETLVGAWSEAGIGPLGPLRP